MDVRQNDMKYIHEAKDLEPFTGFLHRPEKPGFTVIVAGPEEAYGPQRTGKQLNQFASQRLQLSIHTWPPGKAHGSHHHANWEQCYYVFSGQALVTVGDEQRTVGPGGSAFMPPNIEHDIVAVGDETLVAAVATCHVDDDKIED